MIYTPITKGQCHWCNSEAKETHHLIRRSLASELINEEANLVNLCPECHRLATISNQVEKMFQYYFFNKQNPNKEIDTNLIAKALADNQILSPRDVSTFRCFLASEFDRMTDEKNSYLLEENELWLSERAKEDCNSDAKATKMVARSDIGLKSKMLDNKMKSISKMMSSLRGVAENLNKNMYYQN